MGIAVSLIITAAGFILALAVHPTNPGSVNVNTVGWILVVVGSVACLLDMLLWSERGPGYMRRTGVADGGPAPVRRRYTKPHHHTDNEEKEVSGPPAPPPGY